MNAKWIRVTKKRRCEICDHGDWCTYCPELNLILCMRVESSRPSKNSMGGWLHKIDGYVAPRFVAPIKKAIEPPPLDFYSMWRRLVKATDAYHLDGFAMSLGVDTEALRVIGCAWADRAWAFPMRDATGEIIGIRLRNVRGDKWAVKGSHQGLFIPQIEHRKTVFIVEGPTDLAAALTLGWFAIGRPSCLGQEQMISQYVRAKRISRAVIITDNDEPGLRGASKLQTMLPILSCVYVPPAKDLRELITLGGDRQMIEAAIRDTVWTVPQEMQRAA